MESPSKRIKLADLSADDQQLAEKFNFIIYKIFQKAPSSEPLLQKNLKHSNLSKINNPLQRTLFKQTGLSNLFNFKNKKLRSSLTKNIQKR